MAKKHGRPRKASSQKPRRRPHHDQGAPGSTSRARTTAPAVAVLRGHAGAFRGWLLVDGATADHSAQVLDDLETLLELGAPGTGITDPTALRPAQLLAMAAELEGLGVSSQQAGPLLGALRLWLAHLDDVGAWRGTAAEWSTCTALLNGENLDDALGALLEGGAHDPAVEAAALHELPLTVRARDLLSWVGDGRGVTSTGALRRADLPEAAALAGAEVTERTDAASGKQVLEQVLEAPSGFPTLPAQTVSAMKDVPALASLWQALRSAGLLDVGSTRVRLSGTGDALLDGPGQARSDAERALAGAAVLDAVSEAGRFPQLGHAGEALAELLRTAASGAHPLGNDLLRYGFVGFEVARRVDALAAWGLLAIGPYGAQVPAPLVPVVLGALLEHQG